MNNRKIIKKERMFCSICEQEHEIYLIEEKREVNIKGKIIKYKEKLYLCDKYKKDNTFETEKLWNENLLNSLDVYRKKNNLLTSIEIKDIRKKYQLTQLEMARMLGLGEVTITRYETKQIQDEAHDKILRIIDKNAMLALEYLENNKKYFENTDRYDVIANNVKKVVLKDTLDYLNKQEIEAKYIDFSEKSSLNGNKKLDIDKLEIIINYIASNYPNLFKVKLMKILWYIDCIAYKEKNESLTGLVYTHQKMGALPIAYDEIIKLPSIVVKEEIIEKDDFYTSYHILANKDYKGKKLPSKEKEICDRVIEKFKDFNTQELVDYMHNEEAYIKTKNNEIICFDYAKNILI